VRAFRRGGVRVVGHQPAGRLGRIGVAGAERAGVLAEQVVQQVTAGRGLGDQMVVVQLVKPGAGGIQAGALEGGGGVGIDVRPLDEAEPAEQPLLVCGQVLVGQVERGRDRQVLGTHDGEPVARRRQGGGKLGGAPRRVVAELPGEHPDRQRQVPAQPGDLPGGVRAGR